MPATSKSQQRLFGIVHKCQQDASPEGICNSPKIKKLTKSIGKKDAEDFASTKHTGLPEKVEENKEFFTFKNWIQSKLSENRIRTGLKFGYPDGYYRSQYPGLYSTPTSATAALDLENEKRMPKRVGETKTGIPDVIKNPKGMESFPESYSFQNWLKAKNFNEEKGDHMDEKKKCTCACEGCKKGDCTKCSCKNCKCKGCKCKKN